MTRKHLEIFAAIYKTKNITQAAKELYMTQPAVSRSLKELEDHYGVKMFERLNRRLYATSNGDKLYSIATQILDSFTLSERKLSDTNAELLRIGASQTIGTFLLPSLMNKFSSDNPSVAAYIKVTNNSELQNLLLSNDLDIALIEGIVSDANLMAEVFLQDEMVMILPINHILNKKLDITLNDISSCDILLRETGSAARTLIDNLFGLNGFHLRPVWESSSTLALVNAVAEGLGISMLPQKFVETYNNKNRIAIRPISNVELKRNYYIVRHKSKYLSPSLKQFIFATKQFIE